MQTDTVLNCVARIREQKSPSMPAVDHLVGDAVLAHDVQEVLVVHHHFRMLPPQPEPLRRLPPAGKGARPRRHQWWLCRAARRSADGRSAPTEPAESDRDGAPPRAARRPQLRPVFGHGLQETQQPPSLTLITLLEWWYGMHKIVSLISSFKFGVAAEALPGRPHQCSRFRMVSLPMNCGKKW